MTTENEVNNAPADAFVKHKPKTLEGIEADASTGLLETAEQIQELARNGYKIKSDQAEVEAAIYAAEGRMRVLASPSRKDYVSARAELAAKALMGEAVDLSSAPAHDTAESMTVSDVQAGIVALKKRRDDLANKYNHVFRDYRELVLKYCRLHGVVNGCRFIKAKREMSEATLGLLAAHGKSIELVGSGSVASINLGFLPLHFEQEFNVPKMWDIPQLKELNGFDLGDTTCGRLHSSGQVVRAITELNKTMLGSK